MASKSIDIKIGSSFNADGVLAANKGLAQLAQDVKAANDEMRKATMRAEMAVNSYAENADKAVRAMGGGYKTLEQQLAELGKSHEAVGATATAAGTAATKSAVGLEMAMGLARGSTEQTAKALALLSQKIPILGKLGVAACGAWAGAISSVFSLLKAVKGLVEEVFNLKGPSEEVKQMSSRFYDLRIEAENFKITLEESEKTASRQAKLFEDEANAIAKMTKAQNEFNREQELSLAKTEEQKAAINAKWNAANAEADEDAAQSIRDDKRKRLRDEESIIRKALAAAKKRQDEYVEAGKDGGGNWSNGFWEEQENIDAAKSKLAENRNAQDMLDREDEIAETLIEARKQKEINAAAAVAQKKADEEAKAAQKAADEKAKAEAEATKKAEADRLKAVEAERKAREKMEADLHAQRVANAKAELQTSEQTASAVSNTASRAQTEFDRAFGMYRSADHGAAQIAEERDYAADYKQLQKDASRYGGKWRIDELASLMAAGDTKGQAAKLEEWRKSSRFTPEVESMVRAAAADQTKTTAEDELRKISKNTEDLGKKLEELLAMK